MKIHHLSCGTMCPRGGGWVDGSNHSILAKARLVCHVLLIETPSSGLVLVDSGLGLEDVREPKRRLGGGFAAVVAPVCDEAETAIRQVEALGHDPKDVRHIVLTHMDLDHAGSLSDFPHATVHVTKDEHEAAMKRITMPEKNRYRPCQWSHDPTFETYDPSGEAWLGFAAVRDLRGLPPELLMIPLNGHSRGHAAVAVEDGGRWLVHAGDAYFFHAEMDPVAPYCTGGLTAFQRFAAIDVARMKHNKERLRELARDHSDEVEVFSAHDPSELARMQAR
ncbi:MAG: MBL fold metallo-hydrolase [Myxococcales bacterium]|nr:MBL fold metallo-hydrolase [Myxococcales bacterium]